jgi:anthranilate phosphoribosyltransferase
VINTVLDNQPGPARDIVVLNAGAAIYAADLVTTLQAGIELAFQMIENGTAKQKFAQLVANSKNL